MPIPDAASPADSTTVTEIEMRNVHFRLTDHIGIEMDHVRGNLHSLMHGNATVVMGDKTAFGMRVYAGEASITTVALTWLMNEWIFADSAVPLKRVKVTQAGSELRIVGIFGTRIKLPIQMVARVEATPDGMIRLVPTSIKAVRLESRGILSALGVHLQDLLDLKRARGIRLAGDTMYMNPAEAFPPPVLRARIGEARVENGGVHLRFVPLDARDARKAAIHLVHDSATLAANYIVMRGGTVRFGKLFMAHTDATVIDADPKDPFDFSIDYYFSQMVEGFSRSKPDYSQVYTMPDYSKLKSLARGDSVAPAAADSTSAPHASRRRSRGSGRP